MIKGMWIRVMRTARGVSQEALASELGISVSVLYGIEKGATTPSDELEQAIKVALHWPDLADASYFDVLGRRG
jgi:transcriptional regulator with XRE-family HTH domain